MAKTGDAEDTVLAIKAQSCEAMLFDLFCAAGAGESASRHTAAGLVAAELEGVGTHGLLQAPVYLRRLAAGTIRPGDDIAPVHESGAVAVFDAGLALGHGTARKAMGAAVERAGRFGIAAIAVRSATHFGVVGHQARLAAESGMIGVALCNTRPMMPAPGGAEAVVGNNPMAIAMPRSDGGPLVLDMAMSKTAMARVRLAERQSEAIPDDWALDTEGQPTSDPAKALKGVLLPMAGAKGFGLALMIDLMCGLLSGGSHGKDVAQMYGDPTEPADCSWLFIALDPRHFGIAEGVGAAVGRASDAIHASRRREGVDRIDLPGERKTRAKRKSASIVRVPQSIARELAVCGREMGVVLDFDRLAGVSLEI